MPHGCLSLWAAVQTSRPGHFETKINVHSSEAWKSKVRVLAWLEECPLPSPRLPLVCSGAERAGELCETCVIKAVIPFMTQVAPKDPPPPNTISLGFKMSAYEI